MAAVDNFLTVQPSITAPYTVGEVVTKSDTVEFANVCRAIWVGGTGTVVVLLMDGTTTLTFTAVPAGVLIPIRARRVNLTNTTATNMVALS